MGSPADVDALPEGSGPAEGGHGDDGAAGSGGLGRFWPALLVLAALVGMAGAARLTGDGTDTDGADPSGAPAEVAAASSDAPAGTGSTAADGGSTPTDGDADEQVGPVVGARLDGSLVELDPLTGALRREISGAVPDAAPIDLQVASLAELAVAPDGGTAYQSRITTSIRHAGIGAPCDGAEPQLWVPSDLWHIDLDDGAAVPLFGHGTTPPSRLPPSPDGDLLAYVTTSSGARCDGALVVEVVALSTDGGAPEAVATHTLPVSTDVVDLVWVDAEVLLLSLGSPGMGVPSGDLLVPYKTARTVEVHPRRGGPVDLGATVEVLTPLPGGDTDPVRARIAAAPDGAVAQAAATRTLGRPDDGDRPPTDRPPTDRPPTDRPPTEGSEPTAGLWVRGYPSLRPSPPEPSWQRHLLDVRPPARVLHLAVDTGGAVWVTAAVGGGPAPDDDGPALEDAAPGLRSWRLPPGGPDPVVQLDDAFVAVAASAHMMVR